MLSFFRLLKKISSMALSQRISHRVMPGISPCERQNRYHTVNLDLECMIAGTVALRCQIAVTSGVYEPGLEAISQGGYPASIPSVDIHDVLRRLWSYLDRGEARSG
jgi:hypothetical protein